jgi:hypothetical protein
MQLVSRESRSVHGNGVSPHPRNDLPAYSLPFLRVGYLGRDDAMLILDDNLDLRLFRQFARNYWDEGTIAVNCAECLLHAEIPGI